MSQVLVPVILSGGSGTRLWPLCREQHPKRLVALPGGRTPMRATARRLRAREADPRCAIHPGWAP